MNGSITQAEMWFYTQHFHPPSITKQFIKFSCLQLFLQTIFVNQNFQIPQEMALVCVCASACVCLCEDVCDCGVCVYVVWVHVVWVYVGRCVLWVYAWIYVCAAYTLSVVCLAACILASHDTPIPTNVCVCGVGRFVYVTCVYVCMCSIYSHGKKIWMFTSYHDPVYYER